jgi:hypothetical protein
MNIPDSLTIYRRLKKSAKKRGLDFDLSLPFLNEMSYPMTCPILGIPLKYDNRELMDDSYTIDRIDSSQGYIDGNIWVISWRANRAKNDLSARDLKAFADFFS